MNKTGLSLKKQIILQITIIMSYLLKVIIINVIKYVILLYNQHSYLKNKQ